MFSAILILRLLDSPPLEDLQYLPPSDVCYLTRQFWSAREDFLWRKYEVHTGQRKEWMAAYYEAHRQYMLWREMESAYDCQMICNKRLALKQVKELVGTENYYNRIWWAGEQ